MNVELLYKTDEYIEKHPTLHEEDSPWKISKILPLIDKLFERGHIKKNEISLLDVGGGAGIILKEVAEYITITYGVNVNKISLDLSPGMLNIQKRNNPNAEILNENICDTTLKNDVIDITLMIDVLEHIPDWEKALEELQRISNYVIFKIPLDRTLVNVTWNFIKKGETYKKGVEYFGHINWFNMSNLERNIEAHFGCILDYYFTNTFEYDKSCGPYANYSRKGKASNLIARMMFSFSPTLCARIFSDCVMILAARREKESYAF